MTGDQREEDDEIHIQRVPVITPSVRDWLLIQAGWSPVRYMTREEVEKEFPSTPIPRG